MGGVLSALTKLAAERMQHAERVRALFALKCGTCGHGLAAHSIYSPVCSGEIGGPVCKCRRWTDPDDGQMELA